MKVAGLAALLALIAPPCTLALQDGLPPLLRGVGIEQRLDGQLPLEAVFSDEQGRPVRLGDFFNDKPVILVLAYYRCPKLCNEVLNGVLDSLRVVPSLSAGKDFQVVVISFDA